MKIPFEHRQSAHCENGVVSNLLRFHGMEFDEPMVFGIGAGLFFSYFPFLKMGGIPVTSFRTMPSYIFKRFANSLGIKVKSQTFSNEQKGMEALDALLEQGIPVGMLTSVFYLTYLPDAYRFHFNAHNIIVYGKENGKYLVSDPTLEGVTEILPEDLQRARFAKGIPEPKGKLYYPVVFPKSYDLNKAMIKAIKHVAFFMAKTPMPILGANGIKYLANRMRNWPKKLGPRKSVLWLGNVVRMQEEIGTGGAGFRFIYAAFLDKASVILKDEELFNMSKELTAIGDLWRAFAYEASRVCKNRKSDTVTFDQLADMLYEIGKKEQVLFDQLFLWAKARL
ncbi:MAG: BtrH N-terminal domain-containing protein [Chitinophagales bacterium]|nr:BtrH N-terminal domain-containing protein [Chitinophagales bacterium]